MLSKKQIKEIVAFDRQARGLGQYDGRRYGTSSKRALAFCSKHVIGADPYGGMPLCEVFDNREQMAYWDAADGVRMKDGAPTRKTLRYNYIVRGKWTKDFRKREVRVFHVAVRLNRSFCPVVKVVATYSPVTNKVQVRDMGYHQLGGWIVYWDRKDYENKAIRAWICLSGLGDWFDHPCKWGDGLKFPWHETVNPEALEGTRYQWCQYRDGLGTGLCDWLWLYREEPHIENLAKMGLYDFITPFATNALKDKRVFRWVLDHAGELKKSCSVKAAVWAAKHGKELKDARRHFELVEEIKQRWRGGYSAYYGYGCPAHANLKIRFDYERIDKLLKKLHVKIEEYVRYLSECSRAGLDLRNEGTLYPPTKGGRKAFVDRIEALEAENERRERAERRRRAREDRERARVEKENEKRWIAETMKERGPELEAFQKSIDRTKTLTGCGYKIVLAKTQEELLKEGKRMGNCVGCGTYGRGIVAGDRLIVILNARGKGSAEHRFDVEIDRKSWKVRQCYGPHNSKAPDEVRELAMRIAESLKAKAAEMRRRREASKRRAAKAA